MCEKITYSEDEAKSAKNGMGKEGKGYHNVYFCSECVGYHLSTKTTKKKLYPIKSKFRFDPLTMIPLSKKERERRNQLKK